MDPQVPQPAAPVPMPAQFGERTSHAPMIAALLGLLLIAETVFLVWGTTQFFLVKEEIQKVKDEKAALIVAQEKAIADVKAALTPAFYTTSAPKSQLIMVDRETGAETVLYEVQAGGIDIVAVPQVGYEGIIYLGARGEGDMPSLGLFAFDVAKKEEITLPVNTQLPLVKDAIAVSPDQTRLAAVYYNEAGINETSREIVVWDLKTGTKKVIGKIDPGQYFSRFSGENTFAGADGYSVSWTNNNTVATEVFKDGTDPKAAEKVSIGVSQYSAN